MFNLFIVLLSFSSSLARYRTKCLFLNDEPCMGRPTFINLNTIELKYYPFIISLNKCTRNRNDSSQNMCSKRNKRYKC